MAEKLIRLLCEINDETLVLTDDVTTEVPFWQLGDEVDFEIAIARNGAIETLASGTVYLEILAAVGDAYLYQLTDASPNGSLTLAQWQAGTAEHANFTLTDTQSATLTNSSYILHVYWIASGDKVTAGFGTVNIKGAETGAPTTNGYTQAQVQALFVQHRYDITGLTGGTSTDLDGQPTANGVVATNTTWQLVIGSSPGMYRLKSGSDAENSPYIIRPDDYNGSTNQRVWEKIA